MGIVDRILGRQPETRGKAGFWSQDTSNEVAGTSITQATSLQIGAVYAAIKLYADTVASLPVGAFIRVNGVRQPVKRPVFLDSPLTNDANFTRFDLMHRTVTSLLLDGNAFHFIVRDKGGEVIELRLLDPSKVTIHRDADGTPLYTVKTQGGTGTYTSEQILHITLFGINEELRGLSPIETHRVTLGLSKATGEYSAKFFEQGASVSGIIKVPGELTQDQAESLRNNFGRRHEGLKNMHKVAVLTGGADFTTMTFKPSDLNIIENMQAGTEAIARVFGIPLHMLQYPGANGSYASIEVISMEWLRLGLGPLIARLEAAFQRLVIGDTTFIKFNIDGLLRPTTKERYDAYAVALNNGILSLNEVRSLEDRPPAGVNGDEFWKPLNIGIVGTPPTDTPPSTGGAA